MENKELYWELISKYLSGNITTPEAEQLMEWVNKDNEHANMLKELQQVWDKSKTYGQDFDPDITLAWKNLEQRLEHTDVKIIQSVKTRSVNRYWQVAAAIVFLCVLSILSYRGIKNRTIEVATAKGEHKETVLPDGSKIWLNEQSSLSYKADFNKDPERQVEIKGEVFFEVTKNPEKPFIILAGKTQTQVLGTSFNVRSVYAEDEVIVSVFTGRVSFKPKDRFKQEIILLPGDEGKYTGNGSLSKSHYINTNFMFWKNKKLEFNNVPVIDVLKEIESCYHIKFILKDPAIASRKITSYLDGYSLNQVNVLLEDLLEVKITKTDNSYIINPQK
ncbi:MAG: FecR domain-containing protein [Daejeonella sp.]